MTQESTIGKSREVANDAKDYLEMRVKHASKDEKLAAVFDIDEMSLSNWEVMFGCGFCSYPLQTKLYPNAQGSAIIPILELFNYARGNRCRCVLHYRAPKCAA